MQDGLVKELDQEHEFAQYGLHGQDTLAQNIEQEIYKQCYNTKSKTEHYIAAVETSTIHDTP